MYISVSYISFIKHLFAYFYKSGLWTPTIFMFLPEPVDGQLQQSNGSLHGVRKSEKIN